MPSSQDTIDLWRFADAHRSVQGRLPLAEMPRLASALAGRTGEAEFNLSFDRDSKNRARIRGSVRAVLPLQCQRCLEIVELPVEAAIHLVAVEGLEEAERLPEECNPLLIEQPMVRSLELVEDELLLAIPLVPAHPEGVCRPAKLEADSDAAEESGRRDEANPFARLADLIKH